MLSFIPTSRRSLLLAWLLALSPIASPADDAAPKAPSKSPVSVTAPLAGPAIEDEAELKPEGREGIVARIADLAKLVEKDPRAEIKALKEALEQRLRLIDDLLAASKTRLEIEHPPTDPKKELADRSAVIERLKALIDEAEKDPMKLLAEVFKAEDKAPEEVRQSEMKDAIEAAQNDLRAHAREDEKLKAERKTLLAEANALKSEVEKATAQAGTSETRKRDREKAVRDAKSPEARAVSQERLINLRWELRGEAERLKLKEAEARRARSKLELVDLSIQASALRDRVDKLGLERMQARYRALADRRQSDLRQAAAVEKDRAERAEDPLDRFKAKKNAELLALEAQVLAEKKTLAADPSISLEDQKSAADRAAAEFAGLKQLIDESRGSGLVALRINNDFRRLSRERGHLTRNEVAKAAADLTLYENALTESELELLNDSRDDQFELDLILGALPPARHAEARAFVHKLDERRHALLDERRKTLEKLWNRADETHRQVMRRVQTLDEEYAYILTHSFWIRDAEPVGAAVLRQSWSELQRAGSGLARLAREPFTNAGGSAAGGEFLFACAGLLLLPIPLHRLRRRLSRLA